jgi:hypothetical protein
MSDDVYAISQSRLRFTLLLTGRVGLSRGRGSRARQEVIAMLIWFDHEL